MTGATPRRARRATAARPPQLDRVALAVAKAERVTAAPAARVMASAVAESSPPESSTMASSWRLPCTRSRASMRRTRRRAPPTKRAGAREPFEDAALYDWEYRRRRDDVRFYRTAAPDERGGPCSISAAAPAACWCRCSRRPHRRGRRSRRGHAGARRRPRPPAGRDRRRRRALLVRGDLRAFSFTAAVRVRRLAFHSDPAPRRRRAICRGSFAACARALIPGGWFAFDACAPRPAWLARERRDRRWARTTFHHPESGDAAVYTQPELRARRRQALLMRFHYQPVDGGGALAAPSVCAPVPPPVRLRETCGACWRARVSS